MHATIHGFADSTAGATRLAAALGVETRIIDVHEFPDGERRVRVADTAPSALVFRSLNRPNEKIIEILLAADALRDRGARWIALIAPYFAYMRQDRAFNVGEAVSQRVIGQLIAGSFDAVVTVAPHLHRTTDFAAVVPGRATRVVNATDVLAAIIGSGTLQADSVILGPDVEATPIARGVAERFDLPWAVAAKQRRGDNAVEIVLPSERWRDRAVVMVDDMISTGGTFVACAERLRAAGAAHVEAVTCHGLFDAAGVLRMRQAGIARIRSADTIDRADNVGVIAPLLAAATREILP